MAIVKLQNGNVLLKNGKVSCSCCAPPPACCMYPAQALADGLYAANDLPNAVTINGTSFSRSGTNFGDTTNGVLLEGNVWARYLNQLRNARPCLIQNGVQDQFAVAYLVTWEAFSTGETYSTIVYRSVDYICRWEAYFDIGYYYASINLEYQQTEVEGYDWQYKWVLSIYGTDFLINAKPDPQNTPAGSYQLEGPGGSLLPATVS